MLNFSPGNGVLDLGMGFSNARVTLVIKLCAYVCLCVRLLSNPCDQIPGVHVCICVFALDCVTPAIEIHLCVCLCVQIALYCVTPVSRDIHVFACVVCKHCVTTG